MKKYITIIALALLATQTFGSELSDLLSTNAFNIRRTIEDLVENGTTNTIVGNAAAVPYPCDGATFIYRTNGSLYDESTGEIDCSGFVEGVALTLKWTAQIEPENANATFRVEVVIPDGAGVGTNIVAYAKDYTFGSTDAIDISNSTIFYASPTVITNNLKIQVSAPTSFDVDILDRALLTVN